MGALFVTTSHISRQPAQDGRKRITVARETMEAERRPHRENAFLNSDARREFDDYRYGALNDFQTDGSCH